MQIALTDRLTSTYLIHSLWENLSITLSYSKSKAFTFLALHLKTPVLPILCHTQNVFISMAFLIWYIYFHFQFCLPTLSSCKAGLIKIASIGMQCSPEWWVLLCFLYTDRGKSISRIIIILFPVPLCDTNLMFFLMIVIRRDPVP